MKLHLNKIKLTAALLSAVMTLTLLPFAAFAKEDTTAASETNLNAHEELRLTPSAVKKLSKNRLSEKLYALRDNSKSGTEYHTSEYESLDIKTTLYSDRLEIKVPGFTGKYMLRSLDESGKSKLLKIVNPGEVCTLSRSLFSEGKYVITISRSTDNSLYSLVNYFGPVRVLNGEISYEGKGAFTQNEYYIKKLSEMTEEQRALLLAPTPNAQSESPEIKAKAQALTAGLSDDFEKTKAIYDFVANHVYYDYDSLKNGPRPPFDALNVYENRVAVCEGYSSLLIAMLKASGIPAIRCGGYSVSYITNISNDDIYTAKPNHAWVCAYVNGKWRIFDATHDSLNKLEDGKKTTTKSSLEGWGYFAIPLEHISSYRRFDGFKSEVITPETSLNFVGGENISANPGVPFTFKAEFSPVWTSATGIIGDMERDFAVYISADTPDSFTINSFIKNSSRVETTVTFKKSGTYTFYYKNKPEGKPQQPLGVLTVTVSDEALPLLNIETGKLPSKLKYKEGEAIDISGLTIKANYENGASAELSKGFDVTLPWPSEMTPGKNPITVSYRGKTASYDIFLEKAAVTTTKKTTTTTKKTNPNITIVTGDIDDPGGMDITNPDATINFNQTTTKKTTTTKKATTTKKNTTTKKTTTTKKVATTTKNPPIVKPTVKKLSMHRLYNPNSGEHFYTKDTAEKNHLVSVGWKYEGIGWNAPGTSKTPVYRLYNPNAGEHHYTMKKSERDMLIKAGWNYEGIGWYSDDAKSVPLYRQYNPNAYACNHNYTKDKGENDMLVGLGWKYEGIGWYGVK